MPHQPNLTGTARAYRPDGSLLAKGDAAEGHRRLRGVVAGVGDAWMRCHDLVVRQAHHEVYSTSCGTSVLSSSKDEVRDFLDQCIGAGFLAFAGDDAVASAGPLARWPGGSVLLRSPALAATIANPIAAFSGLDKITGRITKFDVYIDETVQFGALQITPRACYTRPADRGAADQRLRRGRPGEPAADGAAHLHRLDVRRQPRAQRHRPRGLRHLARRLQNDERHAAAAEPGAGSRAGAVAATRGRRRGRTRRCWGR